MGFICPLAEGLYPVLVGDMGGMNCVGAKDFFVRVIFNHRGHREIIFNKKYSVLSVCSSDLSGRRAKTEAGGEKKWK